MVGLKGNIRVQVADYVGLQVLDPLISSIKSLHLARKASVPALWHVDQFDPRMLPEISAYDVSRIVRRSIIHDHPFDWCDRLMDHRLNGLLDECAFIASWGDQYIQRKRGTLIQTLAIPRGQIAMAIGRASHDAKAFELTAQRGSPVNGICSNPFLEYAFETTEYRIRVTINPDGTWSYALDTILLVHGRPEPFHHTDRNTLRKVGEPTPNPTARA